MEIILYLLLFIIPIGISVIVAVYIIENFWRSIVEQHAPFVPIPKKIIPSVIDALRIHNGSTLYDFGCGDARVLEKCYLHQPYASYKGIEVAFVPRVLAWFRLKKIKGNHTISIYRGNFFERDISDATHIFTYLLPRVMDYLLPKFQKECKPGTRIVSCDFQFQEKKPVEIIDLHRPVRALGRYLYIYEF